MQTMILNEYGPEASFVPAERAKPQAVAGHVVVRVKATSVNTVDTMIREMGKDLPLSPDLPARRFWSMAARAASATWPFSWPFIRAPRYSRQARARQSSPASRGMARARSTIAPSPSRIT